MNAKRIALRSVAVAVGLIVLGTVLLIPAETPTCAS